MSCIYVLLCPETLAVRYVGITKAPLNWRLSNHISEARRRNASHRNSWIRGLLNKGMVPLIQHDFDVPDGANWEDVERSRIAHYRALGANLVNGTDGGIGLYKPSADVRARMGKSSKTRQWTAEGLARQVAKAKLMGAKNRGRKKSDEERALMRERYTGRKPSEETRAKMRLAQSARKVRQPHTAETKAKMSATRKGRKLSPEHKAAISAAYQRRISLGAG